MIRFVMTAIVLSLSFVASSSAAEAEKQGCTSNTECDFGLYCAKPAGACEHRGVCETAPEVCYDLWDPVCGCDGKTYSNSCFSAMAGSSVAHSGTCKAEKANACVSNADCAADAFCFKPTAHCKGPGSCEARPEVCTDQYDPVCGCDNKTYSNACAAHAAGASVAALGRCKK